MGFSIEGRKKAADGGIDIIVVSSEPLVSGRYIVQCKRYTSSVSSPIVRDLYGVVNAANANKGILITTSSFTSDAIEFARDKPIELIDGPKLTDLLHKHSLLTLTEEETTNPTRLATGMLRNVLAGMAGLFEKALLNIDSELNLLGRHVFGIEEDRRTYEAYRQFILAINRRIKQAIDASMEISPRMNEFLHSDAPEPESAKIIGNQLRELSQFLLELHKEIRQASPPSDFGVVHEMYTNMVRAYLTDYGRFLRQVELTLEMGSGNVNYEIVLTGSEELAPAFKEAWNRTH
jgi:hypothetical protein